MTAADWQAIAEWVTAATVLTGAVSWAWNRTRPLGILFASRLRKAVRSVLRSEVTAGAAWASVSEIPEVSMEAGIAFARTAARSGHPPYTPTSGRPDPEQPLGYLLAKMGETVWEAVSAGQSESGPNLVPVRNYMIALAAKVGISPARDFALGVLTERVRQERRRLAGSSGRPQRSADWARNRGEPPVPAGAQARSGRRHLPHRIARVRRTPR